MQEDRPQWTFKDEDAAAPALQRPDRPASGGEISWTASEFIAHSKGTGWYAGLVAGILGVTALAYFATSEILPPVTVFAMGIIFGFLANKQPEEKKYVLDERGLKIGDKLYPYNSFRSFSIVQEEGVESIWFMPLQRFMPSLSIYFDPEDGDKIVDVLAQYLPLENRQLDMIDRLLHRLRF